MKTEQIEVNKLIARRVPPGDQWILVYEQKQIEQPKPKKFNLYGE
jgi:hypothetical protein